MHKLQDLTELYEADEVAWLDHHVELIAHREYDKIDYDNLQEFLESMARSERRGVKSHLARLIEHLLKWDYQPGRRGNSWRRTLVVQRQRLRDRLQSGSLRRHAEAILPEAYEDGAAAASAATGIAVTAFPAACPWTLDQLLAGDAP